MSNQINVLLVYDKNYQPIAHYVINSIKAFNPDAKIHAVVDNSINRKIDGVRYYFHNPVQKRCHTKAFKINNGIIYNYIYAMDFIECDKFILLGLDQIVNRDLTELYNTETSKWGVAGITVNHPKHNNLKGMSHYFANDYWCEGLTPEAKWFKNASMVVDLYKLRRAGGLQVIKDMIESHEMTEMAAINFWANGDYTEIDPRWNISANYEKREPEDLWILDWHGEKPWKGSNKYRDYWDKYQ